eukprot:TRINITY_DN10170_c0_g1_i1.p1 TRINITY_DN10170_c0_g1~~TRINITY_DN10170_c0_g1_i1.p1  ORF type:complete len:209 (-),score=38.21 TRINITY_DN10170_c0_g1_i1:70-696(-)
MHRLRPLAGRLSRFGCPRYNTSGFVAAVKSELDSDLSVPSLSPPAGFEVVDRSGNCMLSLKRTFENEVITVQAHLPFPLPYDTPAEELSVLFEVLLEKPSAVKSGVVEAECRTVDVGFDIEAFRWYDEKDKKVAKDETAEADYTREMRYKGPNLDDLEEDLQQNLVGLLEERGIDVDFCRFLQQYAKNVKEPAEYERWLNGLHKFFSS